MIFKEYSNPFIFLDVLIKQGKLSPGINEIIQSVENEKLWQMYLHTLPYNELSFNDWKGELYAAQDDDNSEVDIGAIREQSLNLLHNYKPD